MNPYSPPESSPSDRKVRRWRFVVVATLTYVLVYVVVSRNGFAKSDAMGTKPNLNGSKLSFER